MADREKLEVQVTTQGAERAARELDKVAKKADEVDGKKIEVGGLDLGSDADLLSKKLSALAGPGGIVAGIGAGMGLVANHAADAAIEADNLAALTGDSVEQASRLNAVWKQTGADTKDLQDVLLQMNGVLATNSELAKQLGVNLDDGATVGERFEEVADALDQIEDAAKRSQIASQVFGEEGVRQYNALRQSVGDLSTAMENVPSGSVFDEEDVEQAREIKAEIKELTAEFSAFVSEVGGAVIPVVNDMIDGFKGAVSDISNAGSTLRHFLETGSIGFPAIDRLEEAESAAASFDRTLLEGLTTVEQVRDVVEQYTGNVEAANIVVVEWAGAQEQATGALEGTAAAAADAAAELNNITSSVEGVDRGFGDLQNSAVPALEEVESSTLNVAEAIGGLLSKTGEFTGLWDELRGTLDMGELMDEIAEDFERVQETAEAAASGGAQEARAHREAIRDLQRHVIEYAESLDSIPQETLTRLKAEILSGDVDRIYEILADLQRGVVVPVSFGSPQQSFDGVNGVFAPGAAPSAPVFTNPNPAPNYATPGGTYNITNYYPVGSTPTTTNQNTVDFLRRNGQR